MKIKDACKLEMEAQLKQWSAQINLLETRVEHTGSVMKVKAGDEIQQLHVNQRGSSAAMTGTESGSGQEWGQVKVSADKIWDELKAGFASTH